MIFNIGPYHPPPRAYHSEVPSPLPGGGMVDTKIEYHITDCLVHMWHIETPKRWTKHRGETIQRPIFLYFLTRDSFFVLRKRVLVRKCFEITSKLFKVSNSKKVQFSSESTGSNFRMDLAVWVRWDVGHTLRHLNYEGRIVEKRFRDVFSFIFWRGTRFRT